MSSNLSRITRAAFLGLAAFATSASAFIIDSHTTDVQEYVNDLTGHFFLASEAFERQFIASGGAGPGWHPTGYRFSAYAVGGTPGGLVSEGSPVCRFYAGGPNTHFFTASTFECDLLRNNGWGWTYEGVHFRAETPVNGVCASGLAPISRLYNNRFQFNDSNHRYVFDDALRAEMVAQGWIDEGIVFCSAGATYSPIKRFSPTDAGPRPVADCENEDLNIGSCVGMSGLPASLPRRIGFEGPGWTPAMFDVTGFRGALYTAQPPIDAAITVAHSFLQRTEVSNSPAFGIHVSSLDSLTPLASIEPLYQFVTRPPAPGTADQRVFPWRTPRANRIEVQFQVLVKTARRSDTGSHAYGAPIVEFLDTRSGYAIDVSVLAFATFPPGSFVSSMDPVNGKVIVSTSFESATTFGQRIVGDFIPIGGSVPPPDGRTPFAFRITRDDFARIVALARASNPALSTDVNDYVFANLRFRNGILGNAELGTTIDNFGLDLFGY